MNTENQLIQWIWRHIGFQMPSSWELLQFSTEYNRGRCAFADRYQFRAELSWNLVKGEPDYERMVSNYISKLEQEKKLTETQKQKKAGWHGFTGQLNGEQNSRFGRYLPQLDCLTEWAFMWPDERDTATEAEILASTGAEPDESGSARRWRAFGMDMLVPSGAAIEGCHVQPAKAEFSFSDTKTNNSWRMGRMGMVDVWLKKSVEEWLLYELRNSTRSLMTTHRQHHGTDVVHIEGEFKPEGMHLKWGKLEAEAWIDRTDGRLYHCRKMIRKTSQEKDLPIETLLSAAPEFTKAPVLS